ncbi:taurine catabolism dioxygenase [Microstroma glucosiphilum]|uniref:Taurine catabolism dioxygenase n=1 Tax=Pseudomicrostroma glucosiphilum TaxID=1684307 RepID=A0A316U6M9_9BASI|nr:taurine catabolism dioxygenase [Pseudomicrostroma glucosiphilum]PWN20870.1 taurine catabolism dioxygenase [Pseudomicrostroma glucosiphilum]
MSPVSTKTDSQPPSDSYPRPPLQQTGILDLYESFEVTPVIGREYPKVQIRDLLESPQADELLKELAIIISRRGVVFFRSQDLTPQEQKAFTDKLGRLAGKPASSGLHIHPIINAEREAAHLPLDKAGTPNTDNSISVISSKHRRATYTSRVSNAEEWHSDITFEPAPADYTSLKVHTVPPTGGDTLWSSGYEIYDLLSPPFKALADSLTGYYAQPNFIEAAKRGGYRVHPGPRGSDDNVGETLDAIHPFVRTNPVTGWKSVFGVGTHFQRFEGLHKREGEILRQYVLELVTSHHTAQARLKWGENDLAVWDNRSTFHAASPDYESDRAGVRAVSVGERPYYDPASQSRREELGNRLI